MSDFISLVNDWNANSNVTKTDFYTDIMVAFNNCAQGKKAIKTRH